MFADLTPDRIAELLPYLTRDERVELDLLLEAQTKAEALAAAAAGVAWMPDDPVGWIEREFYVPETNAPIILEPYQRAVLREALKRDERGLFVYSLVLYSDIKKSAKSTIAGAVVLWLAWHTEWETCRVAGNDLDQAASRTFFYIQRAIALNPRLKSRCKQVRNTITLPNHTTIRAIPIDPDGEAGGGDLIICFTELWAYKSEAHQRMWTETTLSPLKFGKSIRWCESYAGFDGESPILENLYESGVRLGAPVDVGIDGLELYRNNDARMLALWNTQPRCWWQTPEYYAQQAADLTESEFTRVHRNGWVTSEESFVGAGWWESCAGDVSVCSSPCVTALDAAVSDDSFAVVTVSRMNGKVYVMECRIWYPPPGGKIDYAEVKRYLVDLYARRIIREFTYDEMQLAQMAQELYGVLGFWNKFSQGQDRLVSDKGLYDLIRDNRIVHPDDPELNRHIANANRQLQGDNKLRIVKRKHEAKIDAAVALAMASDRIIYYHVGD